MKHVRFLITAGLLLATCGAVADDGNLLERLRIDHAALVAAEQDFHDRRQRGSLNGREAADYAGYVARLHRQVAEDCVALSAAGLPVPSGLGCPSQPPPVLAPAAIDQTGEQTTDEQIASLDAELLSGLGEFDEMLLREQVRVRAAAPMTDAAGGGGAGDAGTADGLDGAEGKDGEEGEDTEGDSDADASQGEGAGTGTQRQGGRRGVPPDIPDGSDDDVVARQLREAAEKETDPELKKKLWEEYRKYKQGTR
ncbi:MAG: hypothetical protein HKP57_01040 [Halobacteria archaeon]|nr:hypothetical protein [Halobacteria archaeon]